MPKVERFTFVCDKTDREAIKVVAEHLRRSQSDTLRELVHEKYEDIAQKSLTREGGDDARA